MAGNWTDISREVKTSRAVLKIARNVAWEQVSATKPKDLSEVPCSPDALTTEFLTRVLCSNHPGAEVVAIELGRRSSGSGSRCSFSLTYNELGKQAGLPTKLFLKSQEGFYQRLQQHRLKIDQSEASFYKTIRPEVDIETPRPYYSAFDSETCRLAVIMEDVIDSKGARFFEVDTPIEKEDAEGMLILLADLHSRYWQSERLDHEFHWLFTPERYGVLIEEGMELHELTKNGLKRTESVLPMEINEKVNDIIPAFHKSMAFCSRGPRTYLIGDSHLRNFYKTKDGKIGFADWQVTQKGRWSFDFAYTILTSLPVEKRRLWEKDLLSFYLNRLKRNGVSAPSFDDAWEIYRRSTMFTFVGWLITIGYGALQPSMQPDEASMEIVKRSGVAVVDLNSIELLMAEDYGNELGDDLSPGIREIIDKRYFPAVKKIKAFELNSCKDSLSYVLKLETADNQKFEVEATFADINFMLEKMELAMFDLVDAARLKSDM